MSGIRRAPIVMRDPGIVCWKCLQCYQYVAPSGLEELIKRILITHEKREPMSPMDRGLCIEG